MNHLAIYNSKLFGTDYIDLMLTARRCMGLKFSTKRIAPYNYLKDNDVIGSHAREIGIQNEEKLLAIWKKNASSKYLCWWDIVQPQQISEPMNIHKADRRTWIAGFDVPEYVMASF